VLLAGLLWKKTTVSQAVIVEHLGMKNAANVSRAIHLMDSSLIEKNIPETLRGFVSEKMKENEP
jgi:hypothetical protein